VEELTKTFLVSKQHESTLDFLGIDLADLVQDLV